MKEVVNSGNQLASLSPACSYTTLSGVTGELESDHHLSASQKEKMKIFQGGSSLYTPRSNHGEGAYRVTATGELESDHLLPASQRGKMRIFQETVPYIPPGQTTVEEPIG